jgi:aspartate/methionine/tyrosine aminotransferase
MTIPPLLARLLIWSGATRLMPGLQRRLDGGIDYLPYYSDRLLTSPLLELQRLASLVAPESPEVIDLTLSAPYFDAPTPPATLRIPHDRRGWPDLAGLPELRAAVADYLHAENDLAISSAEEILITAGALGAAQVIFDAFVNRGSAVALLDPVSPMYPLLARTRGAAIRWIGTRNDQGRLRIRLDHLSRRIGGARLLVLTSPNNPDGGVISAEDLEQVAWWANRLDVLILSDEVFSRFALDGEAVSIGRFERARRRTLTVGSVSKSHALAWARVGWIAAHRHLLRPCLATAALRCPFVSTLSQQIAANALRGSSGETFCQQLLTRRRHVFERLRAAGLQADWPAGGFYLWLRVPTGWRDGQDFADSLLRTCRVRVAPGDLFGPSGTARVRLSLLGEDGRLDEGIHRLVDLVKGERTKPSGLSLRVRLAG